MFRTDWFRFHIHVERGRILLLDPSNIPARRVRVLTNRQGTERRRELVQDIAATAAPVKTTDGPPVSS
jgi:hypothetical protein